MARYRSEHILQVLNHEAFDGMHYIEPFVGYAHILRRVVNKRTYAAMLLQAVQAGGEVQTSQFHRKGQHRGAHRAAVCAPVVRCARGAAG